MANRYIPFGYEISDAEVRIVEREAEVVRNIFSLYVQGLSLKTISERLNLLTISYAGDGRAWDKNIVKRIIENPKYTGYKDYPVIIPQETADLALACKKQRCTDIDEKDKCRLDAYRDKTRCSVCGSRMMRLHSNGGKRKKTYWKCIDKNCEGHNHVLNEKIFDYIVAELLNSISDDFEMLTVDVEKSFDKDEEIVRSSKAVNEMMDDPEADSNEIIGKMLELASMKFKRCPNADNSAVTKKIEKCMAIYSHQPIADGKIINEVIRKIRIAPDKTMTIELINGKEFERRKLRI